MKTNRRNILVWNDLADFVCYREASWIATTADTGSYYTKEW